MTKYQRIYQELLDKIKTKEYKTGDYLPSENELMKTYSSSRDTIRKALQLLLQNGYIQKVVGKGSVVLDSERIAFPVSGISSFKELKESMDGKIETIVEEFNLVPADDKLKDELHMDDGNVYIVERVRSINGEKIILDKDYLNGNIIQGLTKQHAQDSIYEYIENELNLNISFSRKEITVIPATKHDKEVLDMLDYDLLVCVKSYSYLEDATLFEYTISKHRPDKFRFVDFARRSQ
ncbi:MULTISPECIES: trehalose operon repressor [unclassified Breznakia]|uniref:trehalose operon repressor n=1 Tax=unclassified Breznakia TaxID=2623764 RepID=UPI002476C33D|nr:MULTISPECIES: trehalose operon repressor [unclassified Breznakia]MDH6366820.1 GntR family trehalose operon transcriptional repressor [Breznakia sp. PH1-1]MDH6403998.1 GntR family trehalose operon transcriptional repressor [Breznakia sp. PF1-11]MDH6411780.1 GntR family trehalose operon transcriptional repressor [Breznakia sp. PFB1-11]MDH6413986.1 GntR family trehalose operon transcriptional repressor [Breznakia sp. PFB1-14]MDH6416416.1 GntR family trehalose operon transcriptional repressor [